MSIILGVLLAVLVDLYDLELEVLIGIMAMTVVAGVMLKSKRSNRTIAPIRRSYQMRPLTAVDFNAAWAKANKAVSKKHAIPREK